MADKETMQTVRWVCRLNVQELSSRLCYLRPVFGRPGDRWSNPLQHRLIPSHPRCDQDATHFPLLVPPIASSKSKPSESPDLKSADRNVPDLPLSGHLPLPFQRLCLLIPSSFRQAEIDAITFLKNRRTFTLTPRERFGIGIDDRVDRRGGRRLSVESISREILLSDVAPGE